MNKKFEEAVFINENIHRSYTVEEISALRRNSKTLAKYLEIKDHLFCPECEAPQLAHRECDKTKDFFATYPNQNHANECSFNLERASINVINSLKNNNNIQNLQRRLAHCIELIFQNNRPERNPFIITNNNINVHNAGNGINRSQNRYYIPRKLLTNYIDDNEIKMPKIYYGNCRFKWFIYKNQNNRLCIYHAEQRRYICSLEFYDKAYKYLNDAYKVHEFTAYIAFLSEFEEKLDDDSIFYNATIYDSRTVYFLIHE